MREIAQCYKIAHYRNTRSQPVQGDWVRKETSMHLEKLARHQHPAPPQRELRGHRVLDSRNREFGDVTALYVDTDERKLRFIQVTSSGFLGLGRKHYLVPFEDVDEETPGSVN